MSGHSQNSTSLYKYVEIAQPEIDKKTDQAFDILQNRFDYNRGSAYSIAEKSKGKTSRISKIMSPNTAPLEQLRMKLYCYEAVTLIKLSLGWA